MWNGPHQIAAACHKPTIAEVALLDVKGIGTIHKEPRMFTQLARPVSV
jgi:hypothetical protein